MKQMFSFTKNPGKTHSSFSLAHSFYFSLLIELSFSSTIYHSYQSIPKALVYPCHLQLFKKQHWSYTTTARVEDKLIFGVLWGTNCKEVLEQLLANSRLMTIQSTQVDFGLSQCGFGSAKVFFFFSASFSLCSSLSDINHSLFTQGFVQLATL